MKRRLILPTLLLLLITPGVAEAIGFEAAVGAWNQDPEGYVSYKPIINADELDIDKDLKYVKETRAPGRLKVDMPLVLPNIYIVVTPMRFESDKGRKNVDFSFGGQAFKKLSLFTSKVWLDHYDIAFYYGIPFLKTVTLGKLNAEIGINARIIDFKAEVNQPDTGLSVSKSTIIPVPMVYVGVQLRPVSLIAIEAEARGIAYSSSHYYDFIGRLKIRPVGPIFIAGGYRYKDMKIDHNDILSGVNIKGPFAEAGIEF